MSRVKNEETSAQIANAAVTAGRVRRSTMFDRLFAVVICSTILAAAFRSYRFDKKCS
jgi:hypothetical protein